MVCCKTIHGMQYQRVCIQRTLQLSVMQSRVRYVHMYLVEHLHQLWVRGHPRRNGITEVDQVLSR